MAILIFSIIILSFYHFIYEVIVLPTLRLEIRYKLFNLRDRLRTLKIKNKDNIPSVVFDHLNQSINSSINHLPYFKVSLLIEAKREFEINKSLQEKVEKRVRLVDSCQVEEIQKISQDTIKYSMNAFIVNTGSWVIYLLPFFIIIYILIQINIVAFGLGKQIQKISYTPDYEFEKLIPTSGVY